LPLTCGRIGSRSVEKCPEGAEFTSTLPARAEQPEVPRKRPASRRKESAVPKRILVVDDNRDAAESLTVVLKLYGHETHAVYNGDDAMERAAALHPDIILLDLGLPRMSGYDLARQIRSSEWGKQARLIAVTGWGQEDDIRRSHEAGFDHHLVKPVDFQALEKLLV
jgi:CheY-like chemotaxis protein